MIKDLWHKLVAAFTRPRHIAPLAVLRIVFGGMMLYSTVRFVCKGWITDFYITPRYFFTYYGFGWVKPLGEAGMYLLFGLMALAALCIMLGLFYRISSAVFFLSFTYVELIDKTNYLNHYYFISLMAFLMMLVPAHRYFSLDIIRKPELRITHVPGWTIAIFQVQLFLVYFFAGLAKLNHDWMLEAMPLRIWLPANTHLPLIGPLLGETWVAYVFSWFGAVYDLLIGALLLIRPARKFAYLMVILFHVMTGWLFKIGMFPYIMILMTLIFFSEAFHKNLIGKLRSLTGRSQSPESEHAAHSLPPGPLAAKALYGLLAAYFALQLFLPFRYLLYPGKLFWTEEGFRFSWRVMLMEKGGTAFFYVKDPLTGKKTEVICSKYLTPLQEKMMVTQPDMLLQFAHFLDEEYRKKGIKDAVVTVESYVTLNGSGSRPFVDSSVDLSKEKEGFHSKTWVLPFHQMISGK